MRRSASTAPEFEMSLNALLLIGSIRLGSFVKVASIEKREDNAGKAQNNADDKNERRVSYPKAEKAWLCKEKRQKSDEGQSNRDRCDEVKSWSNTSACGYKNAGNE